MNGYYFCKKCNIYIKIYSCKAKKQKEIINCCPHCQRKRINNIAGKKFFEIDSKLWLSVHRIYIRKNIHLGIKYV